MFFFKNLKQSSIQTLTDRPLRDCPDRRERGGATFSVESRKAMTNSISDSSFP